MLQFLQGILYAVEIVVGLGLLIFIHELGHFILAKVHGVKVEAFSLGMGWILWKRTWGGTEYRISSVPLGGYVKMAGENIGDPRTGAPDELTSKSAWQRLQIFAAGALMNLVIAFPISILAFLLGRSVDVPEVSVPGHPETIAGIKPGDVILEVDGVPIESMMQYRKEMVRRPEGATVPVRVRHPDGKVDVLNVRQSGSERHAMTAPRLTTVAGVRPESPAEKAGLRPGDVILKVEDQSVLTSAPINEALHKSPGRPVRLTIRRSDGKREDVFTVDVTPPASRVAVWPEDHRMSEAAVERVIANSPADTMLGDQPFLMKGDIIRRIGDSEIRHWQDLKEAIEKSPGVPLKFTRERDKSVAMMEIIPTYSPRGTGQIGIVPLTTNKIVEVAEDSYYYAQGLRSGDEVVQLEKYDPKKKQWESAYNEIAISEIFGSRPDKQAIHVVVRRGKERKELDIPGKPDEIGDIEALGLTNHRGDLLLAGTMFLRYWKFDEAVRDGLWEPVDITKLTFQIMKKLIVGQESTKNLAGPVGIFQASFMNAKLGLGNLMWLLVLITVNLGIFNLLPVPVLDGGHILLLVIEKVRGRPPSPRFVERFQMVGLVLLLALIVFVTFNDVSRLFGGLWPG